MADSTTTATKTYVGNGSGHNSGLTDIPVVNQSEIPSAISSNNVTVTMNMASPSGATASDANSYVSNGSARDDNLDKLAIANGHSQDSSDKLGMSPEARYQRMKRKLQLENERIANQLDQANTRITRLRREKSLLLDRLVKATDKHMDDDSASDEEIEMLKPSATGAPIISVNSSMIAEAEQKAATRQALSKHVAAHISQMGHAGMLHGTLTPGSHDMSNMAYTSATNTAALSHMGGLNTPNASAMSGVQSIPMAKAASSGGSRPRRNRRIITHTRKVQPIPRDENGRAILPVQVGILTIISLGKVEYDREAFHNERYIWPVGYTVQRPYASMKYPDKQTIYTCSVRDGVDGPKFYLEPEDQPDGVIEANTATGAWTTAVPRTLKLGFRPDYFGFSHPTIAMLIQELPEAEKCKHYVFQKFEEMKPRRAARSKAANQRYTPKTRRAKTPAKTDGEDEAHEDEEDDDDDDEEDIDGEEERY
ncbi:F/Y-rich N-terminus-domain-containing protein [Syncephalis fuscata]|nr:F/Y-rich N-terminus-domain-containing protein [Syncephalis fuscata]